MASVARRLAVDRMVVFMMLCSLEKQVAYQLEFAGAGLELGEGAGEVFAELQAGFSKRQATRGEKADDAEMGGESGGTDLELCFRKEGFAGGEELAGVGDLGEVEPEGGDESGLAIVGVEPPGVGGGGQAGAFAGERESVAVDVEGGGEVAESEGFAVGESTRGEDVEEGERGAFVEVDPGADAAVG